MKILLHTINKIDEKVKGFTLAFLMGTTVVYGITPLTIPHSFNEGDMISASEMNENFQALKAKIDELSGEVTGVPVGTIVPFAGDKNSVPPGWLLCDGSALSRTTYSELFGVISVNWGGGDHLTTFNLPDLRGRFLRGVNHNAKDGADKEIDPDTGSRSALHGGGNIGDNVGSYQDDAFQGHWHSLYGATQKGGTNSDRDQTSSTSKYLGDDHVQDAVSDGSNGNPRISSETRPKNAYVNYIIKH